MDATDDTEPMEAAAGHVCGCAYHLGQLQAAAATGDTSAAAVLTIKGRTS
jgi:hypothetical protein